ncbi:MAG: hypothetical protein AB7P03_27505 [Kofleriaceae bacterium]
MKFTIKVAGCLAASWLAVGCTSSPGSEPGDDTDPDVVEPGSGPLGSEDVKIVAVKGGWLVPTQSASGHKLFVVIAKEDVQVGKASVTGATMANLPEGKNPFGHPEGYYRIQHHSHLPLAHDPRVRIFVSESRDMHDPTMFTLRPDMSTSESGGFMFDNLESITNASHQLGVGLGTNEQKKADLLSRTQAKYDQIATLEGLPPVKLHYEIQLGILARMGFNANDPLAGGLNKNQPILVADRIRSILAAETIDLDDPDLTTAKPCNGPVPGEPTPDPSCDGGDGCPEGGGDGGDDGGGDCNGGDGCPEGGGDVSEPPIL